MTILISNNISISSEEQILLFNQIQNLKENIFKHIHKFKINFVHYVKEDNITVKQYYKNIYSFLNDTINSSIKILNLCFKDLTTFDYQTIFNTIVIYGVSVYYLNELFQNKLLLRVLKPATVKIVKQKIQNELKDNFYISFKKLVFQFLLNGNIIQSENVEENQYFKDCNTFNLVLKDCCENIENIEVVA
jgi:hypothetical protein